jgi:hypothetical protein
VKTQHEQEPQFDLGFQPAPAPSAPKGSDLLVVAREGTALSPAQVEFNKLMKRLENARAKQKRERNRMDDLMKTCVAELLPLLETIHRLNFEMVVLGLEYLKTLKLTARRREALEELLCGKASELVNDSSGLSEAEVEQMRLVVEAMRAGQPEPSEEEQTGAFNAMRDMMEDIVRQAGIDMDFSDLNMNDDPAEMERKLKAKMDAAIGGSTGQTTSATRRGRKPTKAQIEKEKRQQEAEDAKRRDLKSLYKQLAKVLHPDLETDPERRQHKEEWMKRLTTAHEAGDLRELLCIEMEWLGEESSNLAAATDEKLKVYCAVLKEQIAEVKAQTDGLMFSPEYSALDRFRHPYTGIVPLPVYIKSDLTEDIYRHEDMLEVLRAGGKPCQQMMTRWADDQARELAQERRIFG